MLLILCLFAASVLAVRPTGANNLEVCNCYTIHDLRYSDVCDESNHCKCKSVFKGPDCNDCAEGFKNYPDCIPSKCDDNGTMITWPDNYVDDGEEDEKMRNSVCYCKPGATGFHCDECEAGYYNFPECKPCDCYADGTLSNYCDKKSGLCICKHNCVGPKCDSCSDGFLVSSSYGTTTIVTFVTVVSSVVLFSAFLIKKSRFRPRKGFYDIL